MEVFFLSVPKRLVSAYVTHKERRNQVDCNQNVLRMVIDSRGDYARLILSSSVI